MRRRAVALAALLALAGHAAAAPVHGPEHRFAHAVGGGPWRMLGGVQDGTVLSVRGSDGFTGVLVGPYAHAPEA